MQSLNTNKEIRESEITKKPIETRITELETLLQPFKNFSSNQLYEMYDEYCRRQLTGNSTALYKAGNDTHGASTTGTQVITVGFKPKMVKLHTFIDGVSKGSFWGYWHETAGQYGHGFYYVTAETAWDWYYVDNIIYLLTGASGNDTIASLSAVDATSFTLNFTTSTSAVRFMWEAYG